MKSAVLCVPEEGESVITKRERRGEGEGKKTEMSGSHKRPRDTDGVRKEGHNERRKERS